MAATGCSRTGSPSAGTRRRSAGRPGWRRWSATEHVLILQPDGPGGRAAPVSGSGPFARSSSVAQARQGVVDADADGDGDGDGDADGVGVGVGDVAWATVSLTVLPTATLPGPGLMLSTVLGCTPAGAGT